LWLSDVFRRRWGTEKDDLSSKVSCAIVVDASSACASEKSVVEVFLDFWLAS
jgi:hypothetical protein